MPGTTPFANSTTVQALWRDLTPDEADRADTLCHYASQLMRRRLPTLDDRIASGTLDPEVATFVAANMVLRVLKNPSGLASESVGPWSVTYGWRGNSGSEATGRLALSEEDIELLTGMAEGERRGAVRLVRSHNPWVPRGPRRAFDVETPPCQTWWRERRG